MPYHIEDNDPSSCEERQRLLAEVREAIRQTTRMRDGADAEAALKALNKARNALTLHMEEHGC
jgi:DNA-binding MurR/RpiR family transcriptional regulator